MFTVEERDALVQRVLRDAEGDERVVAERSWARSPSTAATASPTWTSPSASTSRFGSPTPWTTGRAPCSTSSALCSSSSSSAGRPPTGCSCCRTPWQLDLSMTTAAQFRPAGPRFRLVFGQTAAGESETVTGDLFIPTPPVAGDIFGWGVIYALHARACIERGRGWQAEHYVGAVHDHALSLACLREGRTAVQARGYDDLPAETLARYEDAHVGAIEPGVIQAALAASVRGLLSEGEDARVYRTRWSSRSVSTTSADEPQRPGYAPTHCWSRSDLVQRRNLDQFALPREERGLQRRVAGRVRGAR